MSKCRNNLELQIQNYYPTSHIIHLKFYYIASIPGTSIVVNPNHLSSLAKKSFFPISFQTAPLKYCKLTHGKRYVCNYKVYSQLIFMHTKIVPNFTKPITTTPLFTCIINYEIKENLYISN